MSAGQIAAKEASKAAAREKEAAAAAKKQARKDAVWAGECTMLFWTLERLNHT